MTPHSAELARKLEDRSAVVDLDRLGFTGPVRVFDVWNATPLGIHSARLASAPIPPRASLLWRLAPVDDRPRVVGSTLHLSAGTLETRSIEARSDGSADVRLALPGPRSGRLWVAPPGREAACLGVGFRDTLDLRVGSEGVALEDSAEIPDA